MITVKENRVITKQINEVMCRYAKKVLLKDFLLKFSFQKEITISSKIKPRNINPLLETLYHYQGEIYADSLIDINEFIDEFLNKLDEDDLLSLYLYTIDENINKYSDEYENNEGFEFKKSDEEFDKGMQQMLNHKIQNPEITNLQDDLKEVLKNKISILSNEIDLSEINKFSVVEIQEAILRIVN